MHACTLLTYSQNTIDLTVARPANASQPNHPWTWTYVFKFSPFASSFTSPFPAFACLIRCDEDIHYNKPISGQNLFSREEGREWEMKKNQNPRLARTILAVHQPFRPRSLKLYMYSLTVFLHTLNALNIIKHNSSCTHCKHR